MASPTQWTWVWVNSGRWWRTGKPGVLQPMGSQRVRHDWVTEQQQKTVEQCCAAADAAAKSLQPCLTLCDPIDGSPPGSTVPGILQARTLEWVASFKYTQYVPWLLCLLCVLFSFVSFLLTASLPPSPQPSPTPSLYIFWTSPLNWKSIIRTSKHADSSTLIILVFT